MNGIKNVSKQFVRFYQVWECPRLFLIIEFSARIHIFPLIKISTQKRKKSKRNKQQKDRQSDNTCWRSHLQIGATAEQETLSEITQNDLDHIK